jgi:hypothetical protein
MIKDTRMSKKQELVELKVPVSADYVSVVRLLVSGLANRLGLPLEEVENLKLVVAEAFMTMVHSSEQAAGLLSLKWREVNDHISLSLAHPSGKTLRLSSSANLALLQTLGGSYDARLEDGVQHLDLDFDIKYKENRPFIFHERNDGRA